VDTSKDDLKLKEKFQGDLKEARNYMDPIQQRMDIDYRAYRNDRTQVDDLAFQISDMFSYVETVVPIVTNNRIRASIHSDYPDYVTHAKGLNDILDNTYDLNNWDYTSQQVMRTALIYRSSFAYTGFDKKYKNGVGKLCIDMVNPRWCLVDPASTELEDSRFFFYVEPKRKTEMYKMYPDKKGDIEKSVGSSNGNPWAGTQNSNSGWFKTWLNTVKNALTFNRDATAAKQGYPFLRQSEIDEQEKHKNVIAYIHYWYRDDNDEWRCSYWADDVLLKDEPNPFWHGGLPYDIFSPVKDPLSMLGVPMSEQMESMNFQRNALMQYVIDNSKLHANPPLLYNTTFGNVKDPQQLRQLATDTGVLPVNNPDMVPLTSIADYMTVPTMPGYATSLFDQIGGIEDKITGVNDSFRGTQQASSGKEVQLQQEAAYTRIKTMIDQFELFNKKIAEKVIVNAMQFYTTNRAYRIKGDYTKYDNDIQKNGQKMPLEVEKIQRGVNPETGEPTYDRTEFFMYANPNEWTRLKPDEGEDMDNEDEDNVGDSKDEPEKEEVEKAYKILQMTVEIEAGSSLPQSRLARREEAVQLAQMGMIDQESVLEMYDWPDREEVMKRMQEQAQKQAEAQALTAQAEAQAKAEAEKMKIKGQMELEQMKLQGDMAKTQANNEAKIEQQKVSNRGEVADQSMENNGTVIIQLLDQIKQQYPQIANLSDDELIQVLTR